MESEGRERNYDEQYPASLYFDTALNQAIKSGSEKDLVAALKRQRPNDVTESISNHLIVRSFLTEQKGRLVALYGSVSKAETVADIVKLVNEYVDQLEAEFSNAFVTEEGKDKFAKLSGDTLFREALRVPGGGVGIARNIADVDTSALLSPDKVFYKMEYLQNGIAENLFDEEYTIREEGLSTDRHESLKEVVAKQIEVVDVALQNNLPKVEKQS